MIFSNTNTAYTYFIAWTKNNKIVKKYYGVRYAENAKTEDFWVTYFTSSSYVKNYVKEHGEPDIKQIRKIFTGENRCLNAVRWEKRVLTRLNAANRKDYLNKHNGNGRAPMSDLEVRTAHKQRMNSEEVKQRCRDSSNTELKKLNWTVPAIRELRSRNIKISLSDPAIKKKQKDAIKAAVNTPEAKYKKKLKQCTARNKTIYSFIHKSGIVEVCTQYALLKKYNLIPANLSEVIHKKRKSVAGWSLFNTSK